MKNKNRKIPSIFLIHFIIIAVAVGVFTTIYSYENFIDRTLPEPHSFDFKVVYWINETEVDDDDHYIYIWSFNTTIINETINSSSTVNTTMNYTIHDLEFEKIRYSGDSYIPRQGLKYWCKLNGTNIVDCWFVPIIGLNKIYALNKT